MPEAPPLKSNGQRVRFAVVGVANTAVDFAMFLLLNGLGFHIVLANIMSTSVALIFSYIANRKYTFNSQSAKLGREVVAFLAVTLFGLWVIQPIIITSTVDRFYELVPLSDIALILAKALATVATLIWNYLLYSRLVFNKKSLS